MGTGWDHPLRAQHMDSFEGGEPRWMLVDSDCQAQMISHEISLIQPHAGRTCEMFELACGGGSMAFMAYPIEPNLILDEFKPSVWTRSSSGRVQLGVRVIFPFAEHPVTDGRLTTILWGSAYTEPGQWQMLQVNELQKKLGNEIVSLRQRFGSELDLEGAYIDCLVLNAYLGPGRYRVQVDDMDLRGLIPMTATGRALPANWRERWRWRYEVIKPSVEQRFWASPNRPPTWLHYQRESLPWLRSIGFTGIVLDRLPSEQQLTRIVEADLGVICPPPPHNLAIDKKLTPALKGWFVGAALDARQAEVARRQVARITEMPQELQRPMVGEALEHYWLFSRIADEVVTPFPEPLKAGETIEKIQWVSRTLETTKKRGSGWVSINLGPNPALIEQVRIAHGIMTPQQEFEPSQANPLGLRYQSAAAVIAGARGIVFRGFRPLDLQHAGDSSLVAALRWIHSDLALWGPWIVGGQPSAAPVLNRSDYTAAAWSVSQSRLVIAMAAPAGGQHANLPASNQALQFEVASSAHLQQIFRLTEGRLERMQVDATPAGLQWQVPEPSAIETFVVTANPLVIDFARKHLATDRDQRAADQLEVVSYHLGMAAKLVAARFPEGANPSATGGGGAASQSLAVAQRQIDEGYRALHAGQADGALALAARASESSQAILSDAYRTAISNLAAPQSSPLVLSPTSLGYHWLLADACQRSEWRNLELPGAQFQNLQEMLSSGWSLKQRELEQADLQVELLPPASERAAGLRLAAYARALPNSTIPQPIPGGYEGASSWIRSSAAQVRTGQLIRVAAKARVLRAPTTPDSGVLIYDNQAGPSLGQLVRGQPGEVVDVELYRFAVADGEFRILAECRGECDIVLESLYASVIEPAVNRQSYITVPTSSGTPVFITDQPAK